MPIKNLAKSFPASQQDISDIKQTAHDAVTELAGAAVNHANRAKEKVRDLTSHLREESFDQVSELKSNLENLVTTACDYALGVSKCGFCRRISCSYANSTLAGLVHKTFLLTSPNGTN